MNEEQKTIATRLGIVAGVIAVIVVVLYFVYSPKEQATTVASGSKVDSVTNRSIPGVFRVGVWFVDSNGSGRWETTGDASFAIGKAGDIPITGTWDPKDGPSLGTFSNGVFTLIIGGRPQKFNFGGPGDIPVVGDWNGDGRSKIGVFRKGFWLLDYNGDGKWEGPPVDRQIAMGGVPGEVPLVGDWNGDGKSDLGTYRPDATFALDINGNLQWDANDKVFSFGLPGDKPIVGDWNGDGRTKIGVFRNGFWVLDYDGNGVWEGTKKDRFIALGGMVGDIPVLGDWNGDGRTKVGVYRQMQWIIDSNGNGLHDKDDVRWNFGLTGDLPMALTPLRTKK